MEAETGDSGATRRELDRVTVNLVLTASHAVTTVMEITGLSKTDVINRAVQMYAYMETVRKDGGEVLVRENPGKELQKIMWY